MQNTETTTAIELTAGQVIVTNGTHLATVLATEPLRNGRQVAVRVAFDWNGTTKLAAWRYVASQPLVVAA